MRPLRAEISYLLVFARFLSHSQHFSHLYVNHNIKINPDSVPKTQVHPQPLCPRAQCSCSAQKSLRARGSWCGALEGSQCHSS